jgi:hypothetical protein
MILAISRFASLLDRIPLRETTSWLDFAALLSEPRRSPCTRETCGRGSCAHKWGACWSPALYAGATRRRQSVEAIALIVFDVEQVTDDQLDAIRSLIGGYRYLVHSTHSDRPDSRCLRFVLPLSRPVLPDAWDSFWRLARLSLVPIADPSSADLVCLYFLPSCPSDASYFIQVNEGSVLDVDAVLATAPHSPQGTTSSAHGAEGEVSL